jgi:hypothetical protein
VSWSNLPITDRESAVRALARQNFTEGQIERTLGAPDGSIRTMARRMGITIMREAARKAAEAEPDLGASTSGSAWAADEGRRRQMIARRAAQGAREALRAFR